MKGTAKPDFLMGNSVSHDCVDINGTINYTNRYKLYNSVDALVAAKIEQARRLMSAAGTVIRINLNCDDVKPYPKQSRRLFEILGRAMNGGVNIEVNVVAPLCLDSWAGKLLTQYSTPGYRNVFQDATIYRLNPTDKSKTIIPHDQLIARDICDTIFMNNGTIKTR